MKPTFRSKRGTGRRRRKGGMRESSTDDMICELRCSSECPRNRVPEWRAKLIATRCCAKRPRSERSHPARHTTA
eukprot:3137451-Rhodomonas_salina.2